MARRLLTLLSSASRMRSADVLSEVAAILVGPSAKATTSLPARVAGMVKWNVVPRPGALSSHILPPDSSTIRREMVRPSPVPPWRRVVDPSA